MPDGHRNPTVEDDFSDDNGEIRRHAGEQPPSTKLMPHPFRKNNRDAASDSGYSSHTSNTVSSTSHSQPISNLRPPPPPTTEHAAPNQGKPAIRSDSLRHQSRPSRTASMSKPPLCTDQHCGDPDCASKRNGERGYTLPLRQPSQRASQRPPTTTTQYPVQETAPYPQGPAHPYASVPHGQPVPNYGQQPQPRQHDPSVSRSRPTSWAQPPGVPINYQYGMTPQANYNAQHHILQGSPSAYHRSYLGHQQSASGDWSGMASGSPHDPSGLYMASHGIPIPSTGHAYRPGMTHAYSARQAVPTISSHDLLAPSTERVQPSQPVPSARRRSDMPGSFPGEPHHFEPASESSSSSESSDSEEEERRHPARRQRRRDEERSRNRRDLEARRAMPPPPMVPREPGKRRPTLTHTHTAPAEPKRTQSRGPSQRSRHSEPQIRPEHVDLDRTIRPSAGKRHTPSYERIDRQPSISHHTSSRRNKAGSVSHESHVFQQYVVEDANGRTTVYDTLEEAEAKANRLKSQQQTDEAESYQATRRGNTQPATLTAEAVKRASTSQHRERKTASHVSGSSRRSTTSSARTGTESIQITRDGTTFSIPTNTTLQIRQTEEGETWVIGSGSPPREHSYYGGSSKSSGSRVGGRRSERGGGRRDTKTEDDGYEPGL
jgi:hypothetical protein